MLRLIALTCLLAAAAAQSTYSCGTLSPATVVRDKDFTVITRLPAQTAYSAGLTCEFNAESVTAGFFIEISSFSVRNAVLTISSGSRTLFKGSSLQTYQSSIATPSKSLQIRFDATGDSSGSSGVTMRVRAFDIYGCPTGWTYLYGNCFGTSTTSTSQTFANAQRACNNMRSNLLQLPSTYYGSLGNFMRLLPTNLRSSFTWIGLTDRTSAGQYRHYWLNGARQSDTSEISCNSGGWYSTCNSYERCAYMYDRYLGIYAVYMQNCYLTHQFACSMPPGGTSYFYTVPDGSVTPLIYTNNAWVWGVVVACVFVVGLVIVGVYSGLRRSALRRAAGATTVVVSPGRVTIPPPAARVVGYPSYPAQQPPYPYPQQPYPQLQPPAYTAVVAAGGGNANAGYMK